MNVSVGYVVFGNAALVDIADGVAETVELPTTVLESVNVGEADGVIEVVAVADGVPETVAPDEGDA